MTEELRFHGHQSCELSDQDLSLLSLRGLA